MNKRQGEKDIKQLHEDDIFLKSSETARGGIIHVLSINQMGHYFPIFSLSKSEEKIKEVI